MDCWEACSSGASWRWRLPCAGLCTALVLAGAGWQYLETRTQQLRVTFLDVGSGDAIVVQAPGNHTLLIDGGGTYDGRFDTGMQLVAPFLWQHYVRHFDLMALTHMHPDHARGLVSILRLFPTQHLLTNGSPVTSDYVRDLLTAGQRWGTQQHTAMDGPRHWQWERLQMSVLAPPETPGKQRPTWMPRNENDRSLVLRLQYGAVRLLLTGDIEQATERWLLAQGADVRADILKVPHHGTKPQRHGPLCSRYSRGLGLSRPVPVILLAIRTNRYWTSWRNRAWRSGAPTSMAPLRSPAMAPAIVSARYAPTGQPCQGTARR